MHGTERTYHRSRRPQPVGLNRTRSVQQEHRRRNGQAIGNPFRPAATTSVQPPITGIHRPGPAITATPPAFREAALIEIAGGATPSEGSRIPSPRFQAKTNGTSSPGRFRARLHYVAS